MAFAFLEEPAMAQSPRVSEYIGMCDASAVVDVGDRFVVANDEDNLLRVYKHGVPEPEAQFDLNTFLQTRPNDEADIEGATRLDDGTVYWITSHGANKNGRPRPARRRLFATEIEVQNGAVVLRPLHQPYTGLLADLVREPRLRQDNLSEASERAPESPGGLNIEGLAHTPEQALLIGFRSPATGGRALIVPLTNPEAVVKGDGNAEFGDPIRLDLGGRGVRSLDFVPEWRSYLIAAGPLADEGAFKLFHWAGPGSQEVDEVTGIEFGDLRPETFMILPASREILLVSDDGGRRIDGIECKELEPAKRRFRTARITLP